MSRPVAVLISDVHYNLNTLALADVAMRQAIEKANELNVPLIVAGDLHDTKANLRGECVKVIIDTFKLCKQQPYVIVGNHDLINEKSKEHSLEFLRPYAYVVDGNTVLGGVAYDYISEINTYVFPYQTDNKEFSIMLQNLSLRNPNGATIICHQGVMGADMGHYVQDKTSVSKETFADYRVISGHYHKRQDIKCGRPRKGAIGLFSYIGNPYTLSFSEANDKPKGFQVLYDDGSLEFVPTNLRKHVVIEREIGNIGKDWPTDLNPNDIVWLKIHGPKSELTKINKKQLGKLILGNCNFKLDLIPCDANPSHENIQSFSDQDVLDSLIDSMRESEEHKKVLKDLWRKIV